MSSVKANTIANFTGQVWNALINFLLVPFYINYLGVESYGLLGFLISLQAVFAVMDLGLSTATNREVARRTSGQCLVNDLYEILFSLQYIYIVIGIFVAALTYSLSGYFSTSWIIIHGLNDELVKNAIGLFGITLGIRWPIALYAGILRGMEKQLKQNVILIIISTVRGVGSILLLIYISKSIIVLLYWQLLCGIGELLMFVFFSWKAIPVPSIKNRKFSTEKLRPIIKYSLSVAAISVFAIIIKQLDKVFITKMLAVEEMGYYTAAFQAFTSIQIFIMPITTAVFPRFSSKISMKDNDDLARIYHSATKIITFISAPIAAIFTYYSYEILTVWTRSELVGSKAFVALSLLSVAAMFNSVLQISYMLQLAAGLQRIALIFNIVSCILLAPLTYFLVGNYGISGGALSLLIHNTVYFCVVPAIMHRHILNNHLSAWIIKDTLPFMLSAYMFIGITYLITLEYSMISKAILAILSIMAYVILFIYYDSDIKSQVKALLKMRAQTQT